MSPIARHPVMAADIFDGFSLIEADAGTGKTWTLANLVLRALLERDVGIEQIAVVTFTNKAAAELRERIVRAIDLLERSLDGAPVSDPFVDAYRARCEPGHDLAKLRQARAMFDEAPISTIHGFCQRILAEQSLSLMQPITPELRDVDPSYILAATERWWRGQLCETDRWSVNALINAGHTPAVLADGLRRLLGAPQRRLAPAPYDWRQWSASLRSVRDSACAVLARESNAIRAWLAETPGVKRARYRSDHVGIWLERLAQWLDTLPDGLVPVAKSPLETGLERLGRAGFARLHAGGPVMPFELPDMLDTLSALLEASSGVRAGLLDSLLEPVRTQLRARKHEERVQSYDDLLGLTRDALVDPVHGVSLAARLRARYPVIFVDECQDTDPQQWEILRLIHAPVFDNRADRARLSLVMVGDPKQSIYGFRNADVFAYLSARAQAARILRLDENQRASKPLVAGLNALFETENAFVLAQIAYAAAQVGSRPRAGWRDADTHPARAMTLVAADPPDGARLRVAERIDLALDAMAGEVVRLLRGAAGEIIEIDEAPRRPRAGDIAILVRRGGDAVRAKAALARRGVGAIETARVSVYQSIDARELLRVVDALVDPGDGAIVRSALLTGLIGMSAPDLDSLADDPFAWSAMLERFALAAAQWRRRGPVASLRTLLLLEFDAARSLALEAQAERRLTNLLHLFELLGADPQARVDPNAGRQLLAERIADPDTALDEASQLRLESDADLVQILTMHKSKGLEFPIVFVPLAWHESVQRVEHYAQLHRVAPEGGWESVLLCEPRGAGDEAMNAMRAQARDEQHADAARLLYVSATRAEHRLYLFWSAAAGDSALSRILGREPLARVESLAQSRPDAIAAIGVDALAIDAYWSGSQTHSDALGARAFTATLPRPWSERSYTGLMREIDLSARARQHPVASSADSLRPDHDELARATERDAATDVQPASGIRHEFQAGARAGIALHGILETADFSMPVDAAAAVRMSERFGIAADAAGLAAWLDQVLATELVAGDGRRIVLGRIPRAAQVREMSFALSAANARAQIHTPALIAAVRREFELDGLVADSGRWHGFLDGFIDLVFEAQGSYWILDWKSNRLGNDDTAYGQAAMAAEIAHHGYALQFCLYTLALHRLLRRRLTDYDYERDFGGVFYAFLRGMRAPDAGSGVFFARPSIALIDSLDRMLLGETTDR